jgi:hypothetical protein
MSLTIIFAAALAGCAMSTYKPETFGSGKTFAIVSIAAGSKMTVAGTGVGTAIGTSLTGAIKSASSESGYSNKADDVFADTLPIVLKEFETSPHFRLAPEQWVLQHKAYQAIKGGDTNGTFVSWIVPNGYKYINTKEDLASLARELNVDAVVTITLGYSAGFTGVNALGLVAAGKHNAATTVTVGAIDRDGNGVWGDYETAHSKDGIGAVGESANFAKLRPYFADSTRTAIQTLFQRLATKVAAR